MEKFEYTVKRATGRVPLNGHVKGTIWEQAGQIEITNFPWYKKGTKQKTYVRLLYNDSTLFVHFQCDDKYSYAEKRKPNTRLQSKLLMANRSNRR